MKRDWAEPSHVGKICISVLEALSKEFHIEIKKPEDQRDKDMLIRLGGAIGYQAMNYNSLQKSHETHKRIQDLEKQMEIVDLESFAMSHTPQVMEDDKLAIQAEFR